MTLHPTSERRFGTGSKATAFGFFVVLALTFLAFVGNARAGIEAPPPPQIWSDKADYRPGETVVLSGANWAPGDSVHIRVNDDAGQTWSREVDVTADDSGAISDQFNLPDWFVAEYSVTATGSQSGTAVTSFTDGNVTLHLGTGEGVTGMTVTYDRWNGTTSPNSTCSGTPTLTNLAVTASSGGTVNIPGFGGNNNSIRFQSVSTPTAGKTFDSWTSGDNKTDSGVLLTGSPTPCISNGGSGTNGNVTDGYAHFRNANTAPVANAQSVSTNEDTAKAITLTGTDADGNALTFSIVSGPTHGTLGAIGAVTCTGTAPKNCSADVTYTPAANYNGSDSFDFKVNDGTVDSTAATVSITVNAVNDAPTCSNGSATTAEDTPKAITLTCADVDGDSLTYSIVTNPAHGSLSGSGASRTYTPAANYNGSDSFTFKANDGNVDSNVATFSLTVTAVNDAPTCSNGSATTDEDTPVDVTLSCADVDGDSLTYSIVSGPDHGSLSGSGASRTYTPDANYNGSDSFTFKANDGNVDSNVATFDLTITAVDDPPTVTRAEASVTVDEGDTAANSGPYDDVDGDTVTLSASVGTVTDNGDGTWAWSFATSDGPDESQTVTITASDGTSGDEAEATFDLTVNNVAPTVELAAANTYTFDESTTAERMFAFSATDPGADTLSITADCGPGVLVAGSVGTSSFKCKFPDGPVAAGSEVSVSANDGDGGSDSDSHAVTVNNVAPTVNLSGPNTANEGDSKTYTFTVSDPGDDTFSFVSGPPTDYPTCGDYGVLVGTPTVAGGSFECRFTDGPNTTSVAIKIKDDDGGISSPDTEQVDVIAVAIANVAPTATFSNNGPVDEGSAVTVSFADQSDPSAGDTAAGFHYAYACDNGSLSSATYAGSGTSASKSCTFGDDGSKTVRARIIDRNDGYTEYQTTVTVRNVNPTASNPSFTIDPVFGTATAGFDFSDAGWLDTHGPNLSFFTWSDVGNRYASVTEEHIAPDATGHASDTRTLNPGCYNLTVTGTAKDDDGGTSAPLAIYSNSAASVYGRGFRPPIIDNERNIAKYGNVVPVKVVLTNTCTGATVTNVPLFITLAKGVGDEAIEVANLIAESVSAADTGSQMRTADGMYIYNLSTKSLVQNTDYTIRIRPTSTTTPWILQAVLYPKK